ncbi:MAG: PAS domain S-box protein, partial [Desulfotignum sp.]|nr:PAS domain S-box protein [Desulfotignum sp.]
RTALIDLGETWLDTRLSEAMVIVISQEQMLHEYGLADITASIAKAKMDTAVEIANIGVGKMGYIFGVTRDGFIVFHPDKKMVDTYVGDTTWFKALRNKTKTRQLVMDMNQEPSLARFAYFKPWEWYVLAVDPMQEIYGVASRMRPYLYAMGGVAALIISLALMLLTRRLTKPLKELVQGTEKIGKGDLDTRIPIQSKDEFGHLAKQFNQMAFRLKETLTALQYSEEHFRALTENASDLIWILDAQGNFKYISPSTKRILGYDPDLLMEKNAFDFLHPEDRSSAHNRFQKRIQGTLPEQTTEQRFRHQDSSYCTLESISKNLLNHPAVQGVVINSRDITQRKIAEQALKRSHQELETRVVERTRNLTLLNQALNNEILVRKQKEVELKKANQAKSEFLANISHEIRTPLNSVIGFSEVLSTMVTDTQQKNYLQAITTAGKHLLVLITNILDLSKIEAGKLAIKKTTVSLDTLFREIHHLFRIKLAHKGIKFLIQIDENMPDYLILDDMRLRQVLTNLVENAVKFTEKGQISLLARINAGSSPKTVDLMIQVRDTGIGIPEDKHQLIFESFEQENADINRKYGGTGLGLAISRQLVELMQGHISLDSHPGRGSTFTILLPQVAVSFVKKTSPHSSDRSLPDITVAAPVPVLSPAVFRQALNRYPDLAPLVKTKILPLLPGTQGGVKISDARDIAENIMEMGRQFDLVMFRTFGEDLMQHAEVFDIEKIALCLDQLSGILKEMDTG